MKLIDRFVEFGHWSTNSKSALLSGLALHLHLIATVLSHWVLPLVPFVNRTAVLTIFWLWNLQLAICFTVSLEVARRGLEGRRDLLLDIIPYGLFRMVVIAAIGIVSTAFAIGFPSAIALVAVWYSPRDGLYAFLYGLALISFYAVLLYVSELPYAPALLDRSIDAQDDLLWTV